MSSKRAPERSPLYASSPFELRVNLGKNIPDSDVRTALATGDMGFLHSFTTGSTVDGPGVRVVAWTSGCMWRCAYCHNPDTWSMGNGIPVPVARAADRLRGHRHPRTRAPAPRRGAEAPPGTESARGRVPPQGGGAAHAAPFRGQAAGR